MKILLFVTYCDFLILGVEKLNFCFAFLQIYLWSMVNNRMCYTNMNECFLFLKEYHFAFIFPYLFSPRLLAVAFFTSWYYSSPAIFHLLFGYFHCSSVVLCNALIVIVHSASSQENFLMLMFADICVKLEWSFYGITSTTLSFIISVSSFMVPQLFRGIFFIHISLFAYVWLKHQRKRGYYLFNLSKKTLTTYLKAT